MKIIHGFDLFFHLDKQENQQLDEKTILKIYYICQKVAFIYTIVYYKSVTGGIIYEENNWNIHRDSTVGAYTFSVNKISNFSIHHFYPILIIYNSLLINLIFKQG